MPKKIAHKQFFTVLFWPHSLISSNRQSKMCNIRMTYSTSPNVLQVSSQLTSTGLLTTISFGARCRFQFLSRCDCLFILVLNDCKEGWAMFVFLLVKFVCDVWRRKNAKHCANGAHNDRHNGIYATYGGDVFPNIITWLHCRFRRLVRHHGLKTFWRWLMSTPKFWIRAWRSLDQLIE